MKNLSQIYYTTYQLKLPVDIERIIEINDPVYTFCEVVNHIDLYKYLAVEEHKTGRPRYDQIILLKIVLFAFMEHGYASLREIEKLCAEIECDLSAPLVRYWDESAPYFIK